MIDSGFFKQNRARLIEAIDGGIAVLSSYDSMQLSGDEAVAFLQEANFWWLSGIEEPGWKIIIDGARGHTTLVKPHLSEIEQIFIGGLSREQALSIAAADEVIDEQEFEQYLRKLTKQHTLVYEVFEKENYGFVMNPAQKNLSSVLHRLFPSVQSCLKQLRELRAVKQPEEIAAIKKAIQLTCETFEKAKEQLDTFAHEYELVALYDYEFRRHNATHAYSPIVANGAHACTMHYAANSGRLVKNKMTVIDIGARLHGYCADITRTYAVNPTKRQQRVHEVVQAAQRRIVALLAPELPVSEYINRSDEIMKEALEELGLLSDRSDIKTFRKYYPHATSHGLGVDVHDSLGAPRYFRAGMVLTVEPGIYIPEENIGVRIEDNILITSTGNENLSATLSTKW
ncbi:MAG: aminopeptidase P family protein [Candidatus Saccharimonas sp.]